MSALELNKSDLGYGRACPLSGQDRSWEVGQGNYWTLADQLEKCIEGSGDFAINWNVSALILK